MFSSMMLVNSSLGIKDISKMIFHVRFILAWVLLIPQLTGNVFYEDFVRKIFCLISSLVSLLVSCYRCYNVLYLNDFYFDSSKLM